MCDRRLIGQLLGLMLALTSTVTSADRIGPHPTNVDALWIAPTDLEQRDLFRGPTDGPAPPAPGRTFAFVRRDTTGRSPGFDVRDDAGIEWSVKLGVEAPSEVTSSRILWAIGYHQPPTYFVDEWLMTGAEGGPQPPGRFRPEIAGRRVISEWKWDDGPVANTRAMRGLLVAQMVINNWDLKTSNNKLYEVSEPADGPRQLYVVRDLGASLGSNEQAKWLRLFQLRAAQGSKNDLAGFEESGFIDHVENGRVVFEYSGPNKRLVSNITIDDVRWTAELLSRISDRQWKDAFRAGGYSDEDTTRYVNKVGAKIAAGLALR